MILVGALFAVFGCTLQGGAATIGMLIAGRFFAGISVGQLSSTVPIYCVRSIVSSILLTLLTYAQAEISPPTIRGMLSGLIQWMLSWGFFAAQWIRYGCTFLNSSFQCTMTTISSLSQMPCPLRAYLTDQ